MKPMNRAARSTGALLMLLVAMVAAGQPAALASAKEPAARAKVTVTIDAEGTDMFGTVKSPKPARCAADRVVEVYKMVDGEPHLWVTDTTSRQGNAYVWSTGNTGTAGRFYAQVKAKPGCRGDKSPVIRVRRNP